ncbi:MAG: type II secretion system protein [Candidatus Saccharibacteria bacterium]|nr:type II secretion system protein [Candidatus Saccharibacteria bacterium]
MVKNNNIKSKRGFTIIEVVLVLAVAGLIFLMVFIALPALQRSQRNTQRRNDYSMLSSAITSYMSSNNGKIANLLKTGSSTSTKKQLDPVRWVNSTGLDPNGNPYDVIAYSTNGYTWPTEGSKVEGTSSAPGDTLSGKITVDGTEFAAGAPASQVFVIIGGNCNGVDSNGDPMPKKDKAARSFAIYGFMEGGGYYCQANGSEGDA